MRKGPLRTTDGRPMACRAPALLTTCCHTSPSCSTGSLLRIVSSQSAVTRSQSRSRICSMISVDRCASGANSVLVSSTARSVQLKPDGVAVGETRDQHQAKREAGAVGPRQLRQRDAHQHGPSGNPRATHLAGGRPGGRWLASRGFDDHSANRGYAAVNGPVVVQCRRAGAPERVVRATAAPCAGPADSEGTCEARERTSDSVKMPRRWVLEQPGVDCRRRAAGNSTNPVGSPKPSDSSASSRAHSRRRTSPPGPQRAHQRPNVVARAPRYARRPRRGSVATARSEDERGRGQAQRPRSNSLHSATCPRSGTQRVSATLRP